MFNLKLVDNAGDVALPENGKAAAKFLAKTLMSSGYAPGQDAKVDWKHLMDAILTRDTVSVTHIRPLLQTSMQFILREPIEPLMQITGLFTRIEAKGLETRVLAGAIGAVYAEDVGEGSKYPEVMFQVGNGLQTAYIGKSGLQASFTDEALRYTTWDIMALNLRQIRNALVRHKEQKAIGFLRSYGTELYNNLSPSTSLFGVTTGRGLDMAANGSVTMDDIFKAMAHGMEQGFAYDTMLVNPQMFYLWVQDPVLRHFALAAGGGSWFNQFSGNVGPRDPWSNGALGLAGPTLGNQVVPTGSPSGEAATGIAGREHGMTSVPTIPGYFPWPMRVIASPFVPFDADTGLTDIYLLSSGNVGLYLVDEDPVQVEWRDEDLESVKVKIRERYGFHIPSEGMGIGVMMNIPLSRNYFTGEISAVTMEIVDEIDPATPLDI